MPRNLRADFTTLELIARAADQGSISRAAETSSLALAAASRRITEFEKSLGIKVFERRARGVTLTPAGKLIVARLRTLLINVDGLSDTIEDIKSGVTEHLSVFACDSAISQFLPGLLNDFVSQFTHVRIELEELRSTEIVRAVTERQGSLGIVWGDIDTRGLVTAPFREDELAVVAPADHALARRRSVRFIEALSFDFVGLESDSPVFQLLHRQASALNRMLRVRVQVRGFDALCRMVEAGLGIGVVPLGVATSIGKAMAITVVGLREPWAKRNISIIYRRADELTAVENRFVAFCLKRTGDATATASR